VGTDPLGLDDALPEPLEAFVACVVLLELEPQPTHASAKTTNAATVVDFTMLRDIVVLSSLLYCASGTG
jgi:hypothetical protein